MWLLHFLPDAFLAFVVDAVLLAGILATVVTCFLLKHLIRLIPALAPHIKIAQIISVVVLLSGVYFKGGEATNNAWRNKIADLEAKIAVSEAKSKDANAKLSTAVKEKNAAIQESKAVVQTKLKQNAVKIDAECQLDPAAVEILNESARDVRKVNK